MENSIKEDKKGLHTWVEIVNADTLKKEIRDGAKLPEKGLVIKKMHKSDLKISYEQMEGGLAGFLNAKIDSSQNIPAFISKARAKLY